MDADDAVRFLAGQRPVTLIITFGLRKDASVDRFIELCTDIGTFMARRSGFISARLLRARDGEGYDYIQIANWSHAALLADAQADPGVRRIEREVEELVLFRRRILCEPSSEQLLPP
jgi:Antibiotic biosynthesis monooxygenase